MDALGALLSKHNIRPAAWEEAVLTHDEKDVNTVAENLIKYKAIPIAWRNIWGDTDDNSSIMANAATTLTHLQSPQTLPRHALQQRTRGTRNLLVQFC